MHYFIDGYNLMFRLFGSENKLKKDREEVIDNLCEKSLAIKISVTLFFDAHHNKEHDHWSYRKDFAIYYTDYQESADDCIIQKIKDQNKTKEIMVVTSDKKLAWRARRHGARTMPVEDFYNWLNKRYSKITETSKDIPKKTKLTKEVLQHYLDAFEKKIDQTTKKPLSDLERWKSIFEERLKNDLE